jgi:hypothetical protein
MHSKTAAKHATLKYPDGREQKLTLIKAREKAFRWLMTVGGSGTPWEAGKDWDGAEHASVPAAMQHLRTWQEKHAPEVDLTFTGVADAPALRAAKAIEVRWMDAMSTEDIADLILKETACDQVTEVLSELSSYIMWRLGAAVQADPAMTAILLKAVAAIERATKDDLSNLRAKLSEPPSRIVRPQ